jgi:hypothetical protein
MVYKVFVLIVAVVLMQLVYFLIKSAKDRALSGNIQLKSTAYIRGFILLVLLSLLLFFMLF